MRSGLIARSLLFLVISHVIILLGLYAFPELPQLIQAQLPLPFNTTFAAAMTAVAGRAPAFLTRSFTFSNPNYRAGKSRRKDTALAYRVFLDLHQNIRRSIDPYKVSSRHLSSSARSSPAGSSSAIPHISLHIAASSSGKGRNFKAEHNTHDFEASNNDGLGLQKGRNIEEKRRGRPDSGQDAYFAARVGPSHTSTAFAIADGVGGWTGHGIDPADFSHGLCSHMANISLQWSSSTKLSPKHLLGLGYNATSTDPEIVGGGTTACVVVADDDGRMQIANLGDSGWLQLRLGTVHHYSNPQTHAFNTPYQMSLTPPDILRRAHMFGGVPLNDAPDRADLADHMLRHGDVLVLATDGVWDNLDAQDVLKIVSRIMRDTGAWKLDQSEGYVVAEKIGEMVKRDQVQQPKMQGTLQAVLAAGIAGEAKTASIDQRRSGPFAKAVNKEYPNERWDGGKVDDIAVLVVVPIENGKTGQQIMAKL